MREPIKILWTEDELPKSSGSFTCAHETKESDVFLFVNPNGETLGTALRNGQHLTYNPPKIRFWAKWLSIGVSYFVQIPEKPFNNKFLNFLWEKRGYHSLPYQLYFYSFKK